MPATERWGESPTRNSTQWRTPSDTKRQTAFMGRQQGFLETLLKGYAGEGGRRKRRAAGNGGRTRSVCCPNARSWRTRIATPPRPEESTRIDKAMASGTRTKTIVMIET